MDTILRGAAVYIVLLVIFRIAGKRSLAEITTFDAVLLLIVSEAIQQALIDSDRSMTNAFLLVVTLLGLNVLASLVTLRSRRLDKVMNDVPLLIMENGQAIEDRMRRSRVSEDDVLERGRQQWGLRSLDQVRYAVLERSGAITIVPQDLEWVRPTPEQAYGR